MIAVVLDLETIMTFKKGDKKYIIEIGAVKVNEIGIVDKFRKIVLPENGHIRKASRDLIGITEKEMKDGLSIQEAMNQFSDWIRTSKDYFICTWSSADLDILSYNYIYKPFNITWLKNYNDIQKPLSKLISENDELLSLKKAIDLTNIKGKGKLHSGIDDAANTAKLLHKFINEIELVKNDIGDIYKTSLYKKCKACNEIKYHKKFRRTYNTCRSCINKARNQKLRQMVSE